MAIILAFCIILMTSAVYGQQVQKQQPTKPTPAKVVTPKDTVKKATNVAKPGTTKKGAKHHTVKKPVKK